MKLKKRKFKPLEKNEWSLRRDEIFKIVFGKNENKKYLKDLLESILHMEIKNLEVKNEVLLDKIYANTKDMRLDILVEIDEKTKIDIEMQNKNEYNIVERGNMYRKCIV